MDFLISSLLPCHKTVLKADVVPVSQLHLKAVHGVPVVDAVLFPDLQGTVGQVTVA